MSSNEIADLRRLPTKRPAGRPPSTGLQDPGPRGRVLVEKYGIDQVLLWYKMILDGEGKAIPLSTGDCLLIGRIARAAKDGNELDRFYDRSFGKVPDKTINLNLNVDVDPEKLSEQAEEMLARLTD